MRTSASSPLLMFVPMALLFAAMSGAGQPVVKVVSTLETIAVKATEQTPTKVYSAASNFEAPNWTRDGTSLIFDKGGTIYRLPVIGGTPQPVPMGDGMRCNGSHGVSPDGALLAVSCSTAALPGSHVYILPIGGGTPRVLTEHAASYFHTWSPDGKTIVFTRPDRGSGNIFAIDINGGEEKALTAGTGISDDPDFSVNGEYIYFNSDRGGSMQIWRMRPDGAMPEQVTFDDQVNWTRILRLMDDGSFFSATRPEPRAIRPTSRLRCACCR